MPSCLMTLKKVLHLSPNLHEIGNPGFGKNGGLLCGKRADSCVEKEGTPAFGR